jgi:hypothetical protein
LRDFQNRKGPYASSHPWIIAQNEDFIAHEWHEKYGLVETKVLGALACRVTSKAKGVGCAERHWKSLKRHKKGKRGKLGSEVTKKLSTISAAYSYELSALRRATAQRAGKLWEENDFENYSNFCPKNRAAQELQGFLGHGRRDGRRFSLTVWGMRSLLLGCLQNMRD